MSSPSEAQTRRDLIDRQLARLGWRATDLTLIEESRLHGAPRQVGEAKAGYGVGDEFADYELLGRDGRALAIVEAKRTSRDSLAGKRQAADYADRIRVRDGSDPFIFLTNGESIWFWDRERYAPREVAGFFSREDLERLAFQRRYGQPLAQAVLSPQIVDRLYQREAIKRVTEAIERAQRSFLLVMATGTGKTRTVTALIDVLVRAKRAQRVLFLADRRELVRQALGDLNEYIPHETRARIEGRDVDHSARIHVATYPSMMQVYKELSPGYYDLLIADESHRSVYNRYKALLDYFDALQIGLTATPTDYIDHNTFELFNCPDGLPTFYYPYETAVEEGYLVNYRVLEAQTNFQIQGIKAGQLPPSLQKQLEEHGIDVDEIDFEGSDLERRVTNTGTTDAIVQEYMSQARKDATGTLPAKTIIFAMSHHHAVELWKGFNRLYPDLQRRGFAEVIDSHMERADKTLDDFKRKDMPRVAISVDMLDTGVDVPAIQNLVFARPVFSQVKFWQMIGRGSRLWRDPHTDEDKKDFLIIDHWNNFAYFNMQPEGESASSSEPLPVRLFRTRLEKLLLQRGRRDEQVAMGTVEQLQAMLAQLPADNVNVRAHLSDLAQLTSEVAWINLDAERIEALRHTIAPLLRYMPEINLLSMTFTARTERLAVAYLAGQEAEVEQLRGQLIEDLRLLPHSVPEVLAQAEKLAWMRNDGFWRHLDYERIMDLQLTCAPLMRFRQRRLKEMITLHLPDTIASRRWIVYGPSGEGAFAESYREQVEALVRTLAESNPALIKVQKQMPLDDSDVRELADILQRPDLFITEDVLREVYEHPTASLVDFLEHILCIRRLPSREEQVTAAFDAFIATHPSYNATQINFLRTIRSAVLRRSQLTLKDLQGPPFNRAGAVHRLFNDPELSVILDFANHLAS